MSYQAGGSGTFLDYTGNAHPTVTVTGLTFPAASTVVVFISYDNSGGDQSPVVSDGSRTWTQQANMPGTTLGEQRGQAYLYENHPGGSSLTITATPTAAISYVGMAVWCYTGLAVSSSVDVKTAVGNEQPTPGTGTDAVTTGSLTTTVNNDVFLAYTFATNTPTISAGTGMTSRLSTAQFMVADKVVATAGSAAGTFTISSASAMGTIGIALKPLANTNVNVTPTGQAATASPGTPTPSISDSGTPTGVAITSATTAPTVQVSDTATPGGQAVITAAGPIAVTSNYVGYPITAATALTTSDSVFQTLGFAPADGDRVYWPTTVAAAALVPETSSGNSTGRVASGPLTGTFTIFYYQISSTTYYDRSVTLVDGTVSNVVPTGQQIQSATGFFSIVISYPITNGQSATFNTTAPTVTLTTSPTLTGQSITGTTGTMSVTTNTATAVALTGQTFSTAFGTLTANGSQTVPLFQVPTIAVRQGNISVSAQSANAVVNIASNPITTGTSNLMVVGNVTVVYITPNFVENVLGNTNI